MTTPQNQPCDYYNICFNLAQKLFRSFPEIDRIVHQCDDICSPRVKEICFTPLECREASHRSAPINLFTLTVHKCFKTFGCQVSVNIWTTQQRKLPLLGSPVSTLTYRGGGGLGGVRPCQLKRKLFASRTGCPPNY